MVNWYLQFPCPNRICIDTIRKHSLENLTCSLSSVRWLPCQANFTYISRCPNRFKSHSIIIYKSSSTIMYSPRGKLMTFERVNRKTDKRGLKAETEMHVFSMLLIKRMSMRISWFIHKVLPPLPHLSYILIYSFAFGWEMHWWSQINFFCYTQGCRKCVNKHRHPNRKDKTFGLNFADETAEVGGKMTGPKSYNGILKLSGFQSKAIGSQT